MTTTYTDAQIEDMAKFLATGTPNWYRETFGHWKSSIHICDSAPAKAAIMLRSLLSERQAVLSTRGMPPEREERVAAAEGLGAWMAVALGDPNVCVEMKRAINRWFDAAMPVTERQAAMQGQRGELCMRNPAPNAAQPSVPGSPTIHLSVGVADVRQTAEYSFGYQQALEDMKKQPVRSVSDDEK